MDSTIEIGNGKRIERGATVYRVSGPVDFPALQGYLVIGDTGTSEIEVRRHDRYPGEFDIRVRRTTCFTTPEEAVAAAQAEAQADCAKLIAKIDKAFEKFKIERG